MAAMRRRTTKKSASRKAASRRPHLRRPAVRKAPARAKARQSTRARNAGAAAKKALRLAGVGSEAVLRATGRAWDEWLKLLDRAGAKVMPHKDIALLLSRRFQVPDWWSQMVTVGYEQARGLRAVNQKATGYSAYVSKTVHIPLGRLYDAWNDPAVRTRWLLDAPIEVRRSSDGKSMRITWTAGGSDVDVNFFARGAEKSQVAVEHGKLKTADEVARQKAFWRGALDRLKAILEP